MRKILLMIMTLFIGVSYQLIAQAPAVEWEKNYGGSSIDRANDVIATSDGGYIIVGDNISNDGNVVNNNEENGQATHDWWVVKTNSEGEIEWSNSIGTAIYAYFNDYLEEVATSVLEMQDGGFLVTGYSSYSPNRFDPDSQGAHSDFTNNYNIDDTTSSNDAYLVKLNASGEIVWQKNYGGSSWDRPNQIIETSGGNIAMIGYSTSKDNDLPNHECMALSLDGWMTLLDSEGNVIWSNSYGGSESDLFNKVIELSDGNFVAVGNTKSNDCDVSGWHEGYSNGVATDDYWIIKVNGLNGNLIWSKAYGGSGSDQAVGIIESEEEIIVAGTARSSDGDIEEHFGNPDVWLLKLNKEDGQLVSQKSIQQGANRTILSVVKDLDGEIILSGLNWVAKIDSSLEIVWELELGGITSTSFSTLTLNSVTLTNDGGYAFAGEKFNLSLIDFSSYIDFGLVKLCGGLPFIETEQELGICIGSSIILEVGTDGQTVSWYDAEDADTPVFTGASFETPVLTENTTYWVEAANGNCVSDRMAINITVYPEPTLVLDNEVSVCENSSVILTVTSNGETVNWYDGEDETTPIFTGTSFETPELTESTSYWVEAANGGCITERQEILVNLLPAPELLIHETEIQICTGNTASFYAESPENVIFWYANEDDTEYLYHGNLFVTPALTETTTYWVEAYNLATGCRSERIEVTVTVNPFADLTVEETEATICAGTTATLSATSSSTVNWYDSEDGTMPIFTGTEFTTPVLFETTSYWVGASGTGECASERVEIVVTVIPTPSAPIVIEIYLAEEGQTLADLEEDIEAEGTLTWYADEELTIVLPNTTPVEDEAVYYVTQTVNGCESEAAVVPVKWLGTSDANADNFAYYPNPVKDKLYFNGREKVESVQVFDMSGRLLINKESKANGLQQLDVTTLPKGTYVVKAQTGKEIKTFKIIKN